MTMLKDRQEHDGDEYESESDADGPMGFETHGAADEDYRDLVRSGPGVEVRCDGDADEAAVAGVSTDPSVAKIARVYKYGLVPARPRAARPDGTPARLEEPSMRLVRDQLRQAHVYRCTLTEIERGRRAALRELYREHGDVVTKTSLVASAAAEEAELIKTIKGHKSKDRTAAKVPVELTQQLKVVRGAKKELQRSLTEARAEARTNPELAAKKKEVEERAGELRRSARKHSGLYWGNYLLVEADMDAASKQPLYDGIEPNDPRWPRWTGAGMLGVQIQGGMTVEEIHGLDRRVRIDRVDERAYLKETPRGERRRLSRTYLRLRVGSNDDGTPVWASFPMIMHREIPKDAIIKWVTVRMRKRGHVEVWTAQVTWVMGSDKLRASHGKGSVGVDIGWRVVPEGVRVAMWESDTGESGELVIPTEQIEGLRLHENLRSIRDKNLTVALSALYAWKVGMGSKLPGWFAKATETLSAWRSEARLGALVNRWRASRFPGDAEAFAAAEAWRKQDKHLWAWEASQREKAGGRRKETYRVFAARLAEKFERVVLEDFDLRRVARRVRVEESETNATARSNRQLVAVSELRLIMIQAFVGRGGVAEHVPAENTTRECHPCGNVEVFDAAAKITHQCSKCGVVWDQDVNAAKNILGRSVARERLNGDETTGTARTEKSATKSAASERKEPKWARKKREKREKEGDLSQTKL
jgi:transposase